jgi:hypothetical protein
LDPVYIKVNSKVVPVLRNHAIHTNGRERIKLYLFLTPSIDEGERQLHAPAASLPGRGLGIDFVAG